MFSWTVAKVRSTVLTAGVNISVRFAGGGGRPGGKPTFNWKQRRQLLLDPSHIKKKLPPNNGRLKPFGDFSEIEGLIDPTRGDLVIDITDLEDFEEPDRSAFEEYYGNIYKVVDISALYGSNKPYGMLTKESKLNPKYAFALPRWNKYKRRPI